MIKKVFFPSTFIPPESAAAIARRIGRFAVYQPVMGYSPAILMHLDETGMIGLEHPVIGNEAHLLEVCRAYDNWGGLHRKDALMLDRLAGHGFYNQDFAVEIRTEILKRKDGGSSGEPTEPDPLVNARVFLQMAQEYDFREFEIREGLEKARNASRQLFEELRGDNRAADGSYRPEKVGPGNDPSAVMTESRLAAWALLAKSAVSPPDLFVTDSLAVTEDLQERFPVIEKVMETGAASDPATAGRELDTRIRHLAGKSWPGPKEAAKTFDYLDSPGNDAHVFQLYAIPGVSPESVIASFSGTTADEDPGKPAGRHTFFAVFPGGTA